MDSTAQAQAGTGENWAVDLRHVSHQYRQTEALRDVSLQIRRCATVGLIGPDGVGKSTLLSLIAGVKIIQQGEVLVFGDNMANKHSRQLLSHRIAFMPQGLGQNLYPTLSVNENVDFHARLFGLRGAMRHERITRLLQATGLAPFADRQAGKLSGGMKQKLSLCCALVHNPELLILDEPTTGVDPLSRRQFWQLIDELRQENPDMTVIVATAYFDEAKRFEYLLAMDDGRLIVNAPTQQVLEETHTDTLEQAYVKMLPESKQDKAGSLKLTPFVPDKDSPPAIEARDLTKRFGDFVAVNNVSFTIERGEIFGFLGSNGCGKSTTMKMLTGLLDASSGTAQLLGHTVNADDMRTRMKIGYMSQSFSLYEELTVRQNLVLSARLYRMDAAQIEHSVQQSLQQFDLVEFADIQPSELPLGIRQRLQLAAACLHHPQVLILDEPTSGVDPVARDMFWHHLLDLSRNNRTTIFVSTHFMNEAQRCDRISFMHQGRVLAIGSPAELCANKNTDDLETAFIDYLQEAVDKNQSNQPAAAKDNQPQEAGLTQSAAKAMNVDGLNYWLQTVWTFAVREGKELLRDKIRLFFALFGPVVLMMMAAWSVSFDVEHVKFAVLDRDQTVESRALIEHFRGSRYFTFTGNLHNASEVDQTLKISQARLVIDIPPHFGRDLMRGDKPEVGFYVDGTMPFMAENIKSFILVILNRYATVQWAQKGLPITLQPNAQIAPRYLYNQDFKSIFAITPGMIMMAMMLIPVMMTALGVVREREIGSITNLYTSPASVRQFLIGKQIPYVFVSFISYLILVWLAVVVLGVPVRGSFFAMSLGALALICAATAFGLLISSFVKSQVAAIFGSAILSLIPALNFSGLLYPLSTLTGVNYWFGWSFPTAWYQLISLGGFTKGLGFLDFINYYLILLAFCLVYVFLAGCLLKKQEV
ncbi:ribosome-associated ATPase/putative transporter RbbA [Snodgrassella communis]|uniref:ribosome-associated ATPase/putative transporter RbbA n=1 Tax=Snodgrassella communis TaxID=2946699 RepID=UPI00286A85E8|nr:ribosome-associated ATPase/putative transporter RbbA [Snodgrassella communis]WMY91172.1 ribosome-associated ATPase/putative transporter RbbA [Snodgrassella communis]